MGGIVKTHNTKEKTNMGEVTIKVRQTWRDYEGELVEEPGYEPDCIAGAVYDASDDRGEYLDWILDLMVEYPDSDRLNGPEHPRWYCYEHEGFRENYERAWTRETYVAITGLDPADWTMLRDCGPPECGFDDSSLLRADCFQPYRTGPYATTPVAVYTYDLNECDRRGKSRLAYQVFHGRRLVIQGDDFACSPLDAIDSPATVRALWSFVAAATEDADLASAFEADCPGAAAWIEDHAELIDAIACETNPDEETTTAYESPGPRTLTVNGRTFKRSTLEGVYPGDREKAERDQKIAAEEGEEVTFYVSIDLPEPEATGVLFPGDFFVMYAGGYRTFEGFLNDEVAHGE